MPKLKGLLDSANAKLAGLLGDFPQGFNAGAVAGFPGWAGDMAYLADTARLALTGADSQAAPEDYVGTTDYIAKQAGYPVPQTLSGQLGAAVGGLMSPGPGDLAKFAPVLSAIPFWHGSPHKYDAVDLSKIGTGEGAQAYGHGYYGADSVDTATAYRDTLTNRTPFHIEMSLKDKGISPELANTYAQFAAQTGGAKASADDFIELMSRDAPSGPIRDFRERLKPEFPSLRSAVKEINGNLYRGEYRWPDPAKEAATPLTGEDLLDWDKPLSKQSNAVRAALAKEGVTDANLTGQQAYRLAHENAIRAGKAKPAAEKEAEVARRLAKNGLPGIRYLDQASRPFLNATTRVTEDAGKWFGTVNTPRTDTFDSSLQVSDYFDTKAEADAWVKKTLGEPTRNMVMFDDKGIKLLERNGSPIEDFAARRAGKAKPYRELAMDEASRIQRASEQGYNTDVYHGTAEDVTAFDPAKFGASTGAHSAKQGVWTVSDETTAAGYAQYAANDAKIKALLDDAAKWEKKGDWDKYDEAVAAAEDLEKTNRDNDFMGGQNVMPLKVRGKYLEQDMGGAEFVDVERDIKTLIDKARRAGYDGVKFHNLADDVGRNARPATHVLTFDPKNIRSKNAAFDPAKKDSANLLAGAAATALGLGLAKQQLSEQERRNGM